MSLGKDKTMEKIIIGWGLPEYLKKDEENIGYIFEDNGIREGGHRCKKDDVKFSLYSKKTEKMLFTMDFYKSSDLILGMVGKQSNSIKLQLLHVHDASYRKKGISSHYIKKLKEYAISKSRSCIYVDANAEGVKSDSKQNALSQKDLEEYYKKRDSSEMPIILED
ncbi:hypothetical protein [Peribacillus frigoritolerans]|uniref:hypothetical protein n=1 Tax=Peribacillus frigoritolerans TaxID=450367 RepID=UPI00203C1F43|nr:hypothetical protein [Peribacillus frigoritolerans]MCM3169007.1 hypothetical protein [Peribacillus frigoritolerans]